ncbi:hypothetical protein WOLCODRAFT_140351, partial [Wolfiporia cocos MD-104 SS10]
MASIETFETTLKEVVKAKRLSASKMASLTDIALKCMKQDTQLVSILFRTHKSLSSSAKVSSLYVFDALSRAARNQVNKHHVTGDLTSSEGNCATFLMRVEGVLDSLFKDLTSSSSPELKEKCKKILDIWVKSSTFPSAVLERLSGYLKGAAVKEPDDVKSPPAADPRGQSTTTSAETPPQVVPAPTTPVDTSAVQNTLMALLSQAANAVAGAGGVGSQTTSNQATVPPNSSAPTLDASQLALFQHLTQTAKLGNGVPTQPIPVPVSLVPSSTTSTSAVPVVPPANGGPLQVPPYRDDHYGSRRDSNVDRFGGSDRPRDRDDFYDDRRDFRGGFRGGPRGRGRGRGRWDDRDRFNDRGRDREWAPPRGRRSRSRSPTGSRPGERDTRPYSPLRRPSFRQDSREPDLVGPPGARDPGKDEFGRDIRVASPNAITAAIQPHTADRSQSPSVSRAATSSADRASASLDAHSPAQAELSAQSPASHNVAASIQSRAQTQVGLDNFNFATFDPMSPASWQALGDAFAVTHGYLPTEAELMQCMFAGTSMGTFSVPTQLGMQQDMQWPGQPGGWAEPVRNQSGTRGGWRGGRGRGRGSDHVHGNGRGTEYTGTRAYHEQSSDINAYGGEGGWVSESAADWQLPADPPVNSADGGGSDDGRAGEDADVGG